jgi:hypothetical protein
MMKTKTKTAVVWLRMTPGTHQWRGGQTSVATRIRTLQIGKTLGWYAETAQSAEVVATKQDATMMVAATPITTLTFVSADLAGREWFAMRKKMLPHRSQEEHRTWDKSAMTYYSAYLTWSVPLAWQYVPIRHVGKMNHA